MHPYFLQVQWLLPSNLLDDIVEGGFIGGPCFASSVHLPSPGSCISRALLVPFTSPRLIPVAWGSTASHLQLWGLLKIKVSALSVVSVICSLWETSNPINDHRKPSLWIAQSDGVRLHVLSCLYTRVARLRQKPTWASVYNWSTWVCGVF